MNEQLQEALAQVIEKTTDGVQAGISFLSAELPDVIHQLLMWKMVESAASMLGFFVLVYAIYRLNAAQIVYFKKRLEDDDFVDHPELLMNFFQVFWLIPLFLLWSMDWLKIWIAPKIYLIEYAASLVK